MTPSGQLPLVVGITGASGAPYAARLLEVLLAADREIHLAISPSGQAVIEQELGRRIDLDAFRLDTLLGAAPPTAATAASSTAACAARAAAGSPPGDAAMPARSGGGGGELPIAMAAGRVGGRVWGPFAGSSPRAPRLSV